MSNFPWTLFARPRRARPDAAPSRASWAAADWARIRAPERHRDRTISERAQRWLARFPECSRPAELCARFPRIANQLAACWNDVGLTEHLLTELLSDRRGRRQGFPKTVIAELELLYECHDLRLPCEPQDAAPTRAAR